MTLTRIFIAGLLSAALSVISILAALPAHAADTVIVEGAEETGFGRIKLVWPDPVEVQQQATSGVLVLNFSRPFEARLDDLPLDMPNYVALARQDTSGRTLRIALKFPFTVETLTASNEVYVNLVPAARAAEMPGLPAEVVARERAAAEAREKAEAARRAIALAELPDVPVRIGVHPAYSRIVMAWPEGTEYSVSRQGAELELSFDRPGHLKIGRLRIDPPPFVVDAAADTDLERATLSLTISPDAEFRMFREEAGIVLDLTAATDDAGALAELAVEDQTFAGVRPSDAASPDITDPAGAASGASREADAVEAPAAQAEAQAGSAVTMIDPRRIAEPASRRIAKDSGYAPGPPDGEAASVTPAPDGAAAPETARSPASPGADPAAPSAEGTLEAAAPRIVKDSGAPEAGEGSGAAFDMPADMADAPEETAPAEARPEAGPGPEPGTVTARRAGDGVTFRFHGLAGAPAAVFERAGFVWALFETEIPVAVPELTDEHAPYVDAAAVLSAPGLAGVRLRMARDALVTAGLENDVWTVAVGDTVLTPPTALDVRRGVRADGGGKLSIMAPDAGKPYRVTDPEIGDQLAIVPLPAPVRGVLTARRTVDLDVLPTAHGLAFRPIADDVSVALTGDGEVRATRTGGLVLTPNPRRAAGNAAPPSGVFAPGLVGFSLAAEPGGDYHRRLAALNAAIAAANDQNQREAARLDLVRFYLAHEMGPEAFAMLRVVAEAQKDRASEPEFRMLRGIAAYHMARYSDAESDLSHPVLLHDPNAAVWRVMANARLGRFVEARPDVGRARGALASYDGRKQARFHLAAAEIALGVNDIAGAEEHLRRVPDTALDAPLFAERTLLMARKLEAAGETEEALTAYDQAVELDYRPVSARALLDRTRLARQMGTIEAQEAIDTLDRLRFTWRGGEVELQAASELASLYEAKGDYRSALAVMREVVTQFPRAEKGREIAAAMSDLFGRLFLDGAADEMRPVEALSLFYDFRELTPVGRDGDRMIRKLADRLVAVDLLDQAAEMLDHQVTHRLRGVGRAQVAARLAAVHLQNRAPAEALAALRKTRQAQLPREIAEERHLLEAQALSALGRHDHALELLADVKTPPARALVADVHWAAGDYAAAGRALEDILGLAWTRDAPLTQDEQFDVLRAAIAYVLAGEGEGVERMRQKYAERMADGPQAASFAIVASATDGRGLAFRDLAREIAQVDTLDRFMAGYRERYEAGKADSAIN